MPAILGRLAFAGLCLFAGISALGALLSYEVSAWRERRRAQGNVARCSHCGAARLATSELPGWALAARANDNADRRMVN